MATGVYIHHGRPEVRVKQTLFVNYLQNEKIGLKPGKQKPKKRKNRKNLLN